MNLPLNFNEDTLIDSLTYGCAVYNHEEVGMSWEDLSKLFPEDWQWMKKRYEEENGDE